MRARDKKEHRSAAPTVLALAVVLVAALALLFAGLVTKVVVGVVALAVLQGLWRGASGLAGLVLGLVLAAPLAPILGNRLEGVVGPVTGTDGLLARFIAMGIAAILVVGVVAVGFRLLARRQMRKSAWLRRWDPYLGAALGLVEGSLIAMMLLWAPLVLEPVARAQLGAAAPPPDSETSPQHADRPAHPLAEAVVGIADRVHGSALGPIAEQTNPVEGSDLLSLAADFSVVSRDPEAMAWLMETPVMREIEALPSVREAVDTLKEDRELVALFDRSGVSMETVREVLNSRRVLELLDRTTILRDMAPLAPELADAIRQARARAKSNRPAR